LNLFPLLPGLPVQGFGDIRSSLRRRPSPPWPRRLRGRFIHVRGKTGGHEQLPYFQAAAFRQPFDGRDPQILFLAEFNLLVIL
jgi:hypothetical protein